MEKIKATKLKRRRLSARLSTVSWRDLLVVVLPLGLLVVGAAGGRDAGAAGAARRIYLLGGPEGSSYRTHADRYKKIIEGFGVKVEILPSGARWTTCSGWPSGPPRIMRPSSDRGRRRLRAGRAHRRGGHPGPVSLGSLFAQPLMVYYRHPEPVERLSQLKGKRLAIGPGAAARGRWR